MWSGEYMFLLQNLVLKDFRIRYRNMSLGIFWSLLNPLIMMAVLTFVFTQVFPNPAITQFPLFVLCGLVPFNFFVASWVSGTASVVQNADFVKRVPFPHEIIPIAAVLSNCIHLIIQVVLLLALALSSGHRPGAPWLWLPVVWGLEIVFVCGLAMACTAIDVFVRDTRYFVEAGTTVLFWVVPVIYSFEIVPQRYSDLYQYNPVAALVLAMRNILLKDMAPPDTLLYKLALSSVLVFAAGWVVFARLKKRFYDYL